MKLIIATLMAVSGALTAADKVIGKADSVTVFTDRAVVKRVQAVESADKTGTLRFIALLNATRFSSCVATFSLTSCASSSGFLISFTVT